MSPVSPGLDDKKQVAKSIPCPQLTLPSHRHVGEVRPDYPVSHELAQTRRILPIASTQLITEVVQNNMFIACTDAGRDWGQEEPGTTEDEMAGWHH